MSHLGEMSESKFGTPMKIIRYVHTSNMTVEFQDKYKVQRETTYGDFKIGQVRNPYDKTVCGVGYSGEGKFKTNTTPFDFSMWHAWQKILLRCYDERFRDKYPAYEGCTVCAEWFNYQNFAKWYSENFYDVGEGRTHIDKDIIHKGNKVYCPEYCLIVPQRINMIFMDKPNKYNLPSGISLTPNGKYRSSYNGKSIGTYTTLAEAVGKHDEAKRLHIKNVVNEYGNKLPIKVQDALLSW